MTPEQRSEIDRYFTELFDLADGDRRTALQGIADPVVREQVESLLQHSAEGDATVAGVIGKLATCATMTDHPEHIGPYRILGVIGHGGMGAVYKGVREGLDYSKQVAIKVIGLTSAVAAGTVERFRQERRILASLEHPNIASLLDGGETQSGMPYLVMEYIEGVSITDYCVGRNLTVRERLELFVEVCGAVAYAHRNLVVHRDIKPTNILVTQAGVAKLLDFGIAKLIDPSADATSTMSLALTPSYASPEQVKGELVSTATDVYSLGVVLYQMMTNRRPFDFTTGTPLEVMRAVCESEPERPNVSADVDNIILMAMRKEPSRRYGSVEQFAGDIRRSLENRPVLARPDRFAYRASKFLQRNWIASASVAVALIGLLAGTVLALQQAQRAERRFAQVRTMARKFMVDFQDDIEHLPGATKAREHMVSTAREYLDGLTSEASGDPDLQLELATSYMRLGMIQGKPFQANLGQPNEAMKSFGKAIAGFEAVRTSRDVNDSHRKATRGLVESLGERSWLYQHLGKRPEAVKDAEKASVLAEELIAGPKPASADLRVAYIANSAISDLQMNEPSKARSIAGFRRAVALAEQQITLAGPQWRIAHQGIYNKLGLALEAAGLQTEALEAYQTGITLGLELRKSAPDDIYIGRNLTALTANAANVTWNNLQPSMGDTAKAHEFALLMKKIADEMHAKDPGDQAVVHDVIDSLNRLGALAIHRGNWREGMALLQQALAVSNQRQTEGSDKNYDQAMLLLDLAKGQTLARDFASARRSLANSEALIRMQKTEMSTQSSMERNLAAVRFHEATLALAQGDLPLASKVAEAYLRFAEGAFAAEPSFYCRYDLTEAYVLMSRIDAARSNNRARREWQTKRLTLWKEWEAKNPPNPLSRSEIREAEREAQR